MLVTIVYVPNADRTGPDVDRMETVEDIEPDLARAMLADGSAREPSADELTAYHAQQQVEAKPVKAEDVTVAPNTDSPARPKPAPSSKASRADEPAA